MKLKVLFIREKWNHMSDVSGFDPLFAEISNNKELEVHSIFVNEINEKDLYVSIPNPSRLNKLKKILTVKNGPTHLRKRLSLPFEISKFQISPFTQINHEWVFEKLYNEDQIHHFDKILFSVAENQFGKGLYSAPKEFKKKVILFFHQPPSWHKLYWGNFEVFNDFKAIVVLSSSHKAFFEAKIDIPVILIKHGVNLDFFYPDYKKKNTPIKHILFVGSWLRDFETLYNVVFKLKQSGYPFKLNCVIPRKDRENQLLVRLAVFNEVDFISDLNANDLRELYQSNDILFLPLIDSTANNAMNEAIACGLPVVTTDIGGTRDYLSPKFASFCEPGNHEQHATEVIKWLNLIQQGKVNRSEIRKHAEENLNWKNIAKTLWNDIGDI